VVFGFSNMILVKPSTNFPATSPTIIKVKNIINPPY